MVKFVVTFTTLLLALSAIGFLFFPAAMLGVVGVANTPPAVFLLRSAGVGVAALIPGAWTLRTAPPSPVTRALLLGLAVFMLLSSVVDFSAYAQAIVNSIAIPSMLFRVALGIVILWLALKASPRP